MHSGEGMGISFHSETKQTIREVGLNSAEEHDSNPSFSRYEFCILGPVTTYLCFDLFIVNMERIIISALVFVEKIN